MTTDVSRALRRAVPLALALTLMMPVVQALVAVPAVAVPAVTCSAEREFDTDSGDLDGDGRSDSVVGLPNLGAVDVHLATASRRISEADVTATRSGRFGTAVVLAYVDADACADLIVSAPGSGGATGAVYVIPGSDTGPVAVAARRLSAPAGAGSSWGMALALVPGVHTLAVGAPASPLAPHSGGAVLLYPLATDGTPGAATVVTQGAGGVPGASEAGDRFGATLASNSAVLAVGAPGESVGSRRDAGAVTLLTLSAATRFTALGITQNTAGVPGTAETGDLFGSSIAAIWGYVAVGVPGESVGSATHAGTVDVLELSPPDAQGRTTLAKVRAYHQNSANVPGANESGDRWGWSVSVGWAFEDLEVVVGAPYEDIGPATDAGSVTVIGVFNTGTGTHTSYSQGSTPFGGRAEKADHFGWAVGTRPGRDWEENTVDEILIGVPGEDRTGAANAGYAYIVDRSDTLTTTVAPLAPVGGPKANLAYGLGFGAPHIRA